VAHNSLAQKTKKKRKHSEKNPQPNKISLGGKDEKLPQKGQFIRRRKEIGTYAG